MWFVVVSLMCSLLVVAVVEVAHIQVPLAVAAEQVDTCIQLAHIYLLAH